MKRAKPQQDSLSQASLFYSVQERRQTHTQRAEVETGWGGEAASVPRAAHGAAFGRRRRHTGSARGLSTSSSKTRARVKRRRRAMECHEDRTRRTRTSEVANVTDSRCATQRSKRGHAVNSRRRQDGWLVRRRYERANLQLVKESGPTAGRRAKATAGKVGAFSRDETSRTARSWCRRCQSGLRTRPRSSQQKRPQESAVSSSTHVAAGLPRSWAGGATRQLQFEQGCDFDMPVVVHRSRFLSRRRNRSQWCRGFRRP